EDAAIGHRIVRNEGVEVEVRQTGAVAVPLIGNTAREILEDAEFEVDARIERTLGPSEQPSLPVRIPLSIRGDVFVLRNVPARTVVVPALANRDDLAELAAADDVANLMLVRTAEPLRSHLHDLLTGENGIARQLGILQGIRHRLLAIAVLPGAHD